MTYTLIANSTAVRRDSDGAFIPADPVNTDWQAYQAWLAAGNTPNPVPAPTAAEAWAAYQAQAQAALAKTDMVALRCLKAGVAFPAAWQTYAKELRNIVSASTGNTGTLPVQPEFPEGT